MAEFAKHVCNVFNHCHKYNLKLTHSKCEFEVKQISVLDRVITEKGIQPDPAKKEFTKATGGY